MCDYEFCHGIDDEERYMDWGTFHVTCLDEMESAEQEYWSRNVGDVPRLGPIDLDAYQPGSAKWLDLNRALQDG